MLLQNYSIVNFLCGHVHSGITNPIKFIRPHVSRGMFFRQELELIQEQIKRDSLPTGTQMHSALLMGDKGSLLSSTTTINGAATLAGSLASGINIVSALEGTSALTADLKLITSMNATLEGSGSLVGALVGTIALDATINGTSSVAAALGLISNMAASLAGTGSIAGNLKGTLSLSADIYVNQSQATVDELVAGVWNAIAADYNNGASMGEIMNNMGAVADPWTTTLPGAYTGDQAGAIIDRLETLIKQVKALTSAGL